MKPDTQRSAGARRLRNEAGQIICSCGCGRLPGPGRRFWHSQECVDGWLVNNSPSKQRELVYKRDRGICADCGCNASRELRLFREARREVVRLFEWFWRRLEAKDRPQHKAHWRLMDEFCDRIMPNPGWTLDRSTGWDADHIVPVVEGGGNGGLENLRTLCHVCHKRRTRELAARRAAARREAKRAASPQPELPL